MAEEGGLRRCGAVEAARGGGMRLGEGKGLADAHMPGEMFDSVALLVEHVVLPANAVDGEGHYTIAISAVVVDGGAGGSAEGAHRTVS